MTMDTDDMDDKPLPLDILEDIADEFDEDCLPSWFVKHNSRYSPIMGRSYWMRPLVNWQNATDQLHRHLTQQ